jgi:hypothetical protein
MTKSELRLAISILNRVDKTNVNYSSLVYILTGIRTETPSIVIIDLFQEAIDKGIECKVELIMFGLGRLLKKDG